MLPDDPFAPPFLGFTPAAFAWFAGLERNNTKAWFDAHRPTFEDEVKAPLTRLLDDLAAELGGAVKVFRQNRDIRFSKDKSPYKTNTYGVVRGIRPGFGLYVSVSAQGVMAGAGEYEIGPARLEKLRQAILDDGAGPALERALADAERAGLPYAGDTLKTAPRGYPRDHPRIALLRLKQLLLMKRLPREKAEGQAPFDHALWLWSTARPVLDWLEEHVGPGAEP
ncbi:MAG: TIGR02453 family protein [Rubricella sp.]